MKKRAKKNKKDVKFSNSKDKAAITLFLISGIIALNIIEKSLTTNILGIAFIIAGIYGIVALSKKQKFMFK